MRVAPGTVRGARELALVAAAAVTATVVLTYPLSVNPGTVGRVNNGDGQLSIWNVAWVARTLVVDPLHVFDANIFHPHRGALAYSEANLGAGAVAIPAYWATGNPYFAHNFAVLLAFVLSAVGTYYLARYLTGDRRAAALAAVLYAFCPHVFGRTAQVQLLMTMGLPFSMLAFHRLADKPSSPRAVALGAAMAATTFFCAYYGVFVLLMVGFAVLATALLRGLWRDTSYWTAVALAAAVAVALVVPLVEPYVVLQRTRGFSRALGEAAQYSADWRTYLTSSARGHLWMHQVFGKGLEVAFPGFIAVVLAIVGIVIGGGWKREGHDGRTRELIVLYGVLALLACWASFGPAAGLYSVLYHAVPGFTLMRAPARFGLVVAFALSILAAIGLRAVLGRLPRATLVGTLVVLLAAVEMLEVLRFPQVPPVSPAYRMLATLPRGPVIEMPFFWPDVGLFRHEQYMLNSTAHWMPLVNGYSDYIPPDFVEHSLTLRTFPNPEAFRILQPDKVRYAVFHRRGFNSSNWRDAMARVQQSAQYLRPLYVDDEVRLYEITGYPP